MSRKAKGAAKTSEEKSDTPASEDVTMESKADSHTSNGIHDTNATDVKPEDASCGTAAEPAQPSNTPGGKFQRELKPPRVLEVSNYDLVNFV